MQNQELERCKKTGSPQIGPFEPEWPGSDRDPEERPAENREQIREKMLDKTIANSFPASDPPSSLPDPSADDSQAIDLEKAA